MASKSKPLPLGDTLRDLALLRATDLDLASLLSSEVATPRDDSSNDAADEQGINSSVERSYEFVSEARKAIKVLNRGEVDKQGVKVEDVRSKLEDTLRGLQE